MAQQIEVAPDALSAEAVQGGVHEVTPDVAHQQLALANVAFIREPQAGDGGWVLFDAVLIGMRHAIESAA